MEPVGVFKVVGVNLGGDTPVFYRSHSQEEITYWLDALLERTSRFHLISELNDLQLECLHSGENGVSSFPSKFTMPLVIVNLVIDKFGLKIIHEDEE